MSRYLDIARKGSCERAKREKGELVATAPHVPTPLQPVDATNSPNSQFACSQRPSYQHVLAVLECRCPDHVDVERWHRAVADGKRFVGLWGEQASSLGWTNRDLFGLHKPPERPHPSYRRLSRYDQTGLLWLMQNREVVVLTADTATIKNQVTGTITVFLKNNRPALGPLGDSLDDLE
jgi:hypothetical protein